MKNSTKNITERLIAFIRTMDAYDSIVQELPVSDELKELSGGKNITLDSFGLTKADSAFINIRLMLQRKYFRRGEDAYLPDLLRDAKGKHIFDSHEIDNMLEKLDDFNDKPIELIAPNGSVIESNYKIAEAIIYGYYLHADTDKLNSLLHLPMRVITMLIVPFVLGRETILYRARDLFLINSYEALTKECMASGFLRFNLVQTEDREIKASPFWKNAYGHDASYDEIYTLAQANTLDDNVVIILAAAFFKELAKPDYDVEVLRGFVWDNFWDDWGDFSESHEFVSSLENPGFSSKVLHEGGNEYAQVKFFRK